MSHLVPVPELLTDIRAQIAADPSSQSALTTIDEYISSFTSLLLDLKSLRNTRTPISSLPPEILAQILVLAVQPTPSPKEREYLLKLPGLSWEGHVELTRVCRRWRAVTLGCPEYWAGIPFSSSRNYPEMLARSGSVPLRIRVDVHSHLVRPRLSGSVPLQSDAHRLQELHVRLDEGRFALFMQHFPTEEAPALRVLNLACHKGIRPALATVGQDSTEHFQIPLHVFTCLKPVLEDLRLWMCAVPWEAIRLSRSLPRNLTTLHLGHATPPSDLLLDMLAASPGLRDLQLILAILPQDRASLDNQQRIPLMHLERCRIEDDAWPFSQFYTSIIHPQNTTNVFIDLRFRPPDVLADILSACDISPSADPTPWHLSLHKTQHSRRLSLQHGPRFELAINFFGSIPSVLSALNVSGIQEVTVTISARGTRLDEEPAVWGRFFRERGRGMKVLRVQFINVVRVFGELEVFLGCLSGNAAAASKNTVPGGVAVGDDADEDVPPLPALHTLEIAGAIFLSHDPQSPTLDASQSQPSHHCSISHAGTITGTMDEAIQEDLDAYLNYTALVSLLAARRDAGVPIRVLKISRSWRFERVVGELRKEVGSESTTDIVWDESESEDDEGGEGEGVACR